MSGTSISAWCAVAERVDAQRRKVEDYAVWKDYHGRFDSYPAHSEELQSSEIRSLTLKSSAKGIHPEFECRAQNRVHVETASVHYASRSLRYRGAAFKEN